MSLLILAHVASHKQVSDQGKEEEPGPGLRKVYHVYASISLQGTDLLSAEADHVFRAKVINVFSAEVYTSLHAIAQRIQL